MALWVWLLWSITLVEPGCFLRIAPVAGHAGANEHQVAFARRQQLRIRVQQMQAAPGVDQHVAGVDVRVTGDEWQGAIAQGPPQTCGLLHEPVERRTLAAAAINPDVLQAVFGLQDARDACCAGG